MDSRGQCWRGFDDFATGNAPVLLENGVVLMGFGLPNRRSSPGLGTGLGWNPNGWAPWFSSPELPPRFGLKDLDLHGVGFDPAHADSVCAGLERG